MILDDENILQKGIEEIANSPFLILNQFLIKNKTNKDFVYYDLRYELELNLILNKIPIEKYGYNWKVLANQINIEKCITMPSGAKYVKKYVKTIANIKIDKSDRLGIYVENHKYDEIVKLLKRYIPESYETIYEGNYISVILI